MNIAKNRCEWIVALRTSGPRQCTKGPGITFTDSLCALQVAKETLYLAGYRPWVNFESREYPKYLTFDEVQEMLGMDLDETLVANDNDKGMTFAEIADQAEAGAYWNLEDNVVPLARAA